MKRKLLIIGLDGATFDVITPMVKKGKLPNIARLMRNGARGELQSTIPPLTPIAWTTMLTGKNAGKHGVFDFRRLTPDHKVKFLNGGDNREKTIFEIASEAGLRCIVINVPMTYPPKKINGIWISGMDAPPNSVFTYPPELTGELNKYGYKVELDFLSKKDYLKNLVEMEEKREQVVLRLLKEKWDFAMVVFVLTDRVQHIFWNNKKHLERAYKYADAAVGKLTRSFPNASVMLLSDHGAGPIHTGISLNRWLQKEGFLVFKHYPLVDQINQWSEDNDIVRGKRGVIKAVLHPAGGSIRSNQKELKFRVNGKEKYAYVSLGPFEKNVRLEIEAYGSKDGIGFQIGGVTTDLNASTFLTKNLKKYNFNVPAGLKEIVFTTYGTMPTGEMTIKNIEVRELDSSSQLSKSPVEIVHDVDWSKTKAFAFGFYGSVYLNKQSTTERERERIVTQLKKNLEKLKDRKDRKVIQSAYPGRELFNGPNINLGPDIIALPVDGYYPIDGFGSLDKDISVCIPKAMAGGHRMNGILILSNGPFKKKEIRNARLIDIAPTTLYLLGLSIPGGIDGRVLEESFQYGCIKKNPIRKGAPVSKEAQDNAYDGEESKFVEKRLKNLGYLD